MSLLFIDGHERAHQAAQKICEDFSNSLPMSNPDGTARQQIPFDGLVQTIILLDVAVQYDDEAFFRWTGVWAYTLFAKRMPPEMQTRAKGFIVQFCSLLKTELFWYDTDEERQRAERMLDAAIDEVQNTNLREREHDYVADCSNAELASRYLDRLLDRDMAGAMETVESALATLPIDTVYTEIIQNVMYEIGERWLTNRLSVAQEHYCTAATQTILAALYMRFSDQPRNGRTAVMACIGSELHELGPRMVSDLLEYHGWDCIFLGAGVPLDTLLGTLEDEQPDLCCLSVTLQQGVPECAKDILAIKERFPQVIVAVGGHAFAELHAGDQLHADIFTHDVPELLREAERLLP